MGIIWVDERSGSKELAPWLPSAQLTKLEFGDAMMMGVVGVGEGRPAAIGVERKTIGDLINSMSSGRLSGHQIPGLLASYDVTYLVVEGIWKANPHTGVLEVMAGGGWRPLDRGQRRFMASEVWGYLNTITMMTGIRVWQTGTMRETAQYITSLSKWWDKKWDEHKSHLALYKDSTKLDIVQVSRPSLLHRVAAELPEIGWKKGRAIAEHFKTVHNMANAPYEEWVRIPGIGKTIARKICTEIRIGAGKGRGEVR